MHSGLRNPNAIWHLSRRRSAVVLVPALTGLWAMGLVLTTQARDASVCTGSVTGNGATIERTISCAEADVSRYFLISPDLKALSDQQRVDVLQRPTYYTLAYMAAALTNDIQTDFAKPDVKSATYTGAIIDRGAGGKDATHPAFTIALDRKAEQGIDWKTFPPMNLLSLPGAQQSPWLRQKLSAEPATK